MRGQKNMGESSPKVKKTLPGSRRKVKKALPGFKRKIKKNLWISVEESDSIGTFLKLFEVDVF